MGLSVQAWSQQLEERDSSALSGTWTTPGVLSSGSCSTAQTVGSSAGQTVGSWGEPSRGQAGGQG